jgi:hypothetical protein
MNWKQALFALSICLSIFHLVIALFAWRLNLNLWLLLAAIYLIGGICASVIVIIVFFCGFISWVWVKLE